MIVKWQSSSSGSTSGSSMSPGHLSVGHTSGNSGRQVIRGPGAKTINVFRACLGAQLTICAQK